MMTNNNLFREKMKKALKILNKQNLLIDWLSSRRRISDERAEYERKAAAFDFVVQEAGELSHFFEPENLNASLEHAGILLNSIREYIFCTNLPRQLYCMAREKYSLLLDSLGKADELEAIA